MIKYVRSGAEQPVVERTGLLQVARSKGDVVDPENVGHGGLRRWSDGAADYPRQRRTPRQSAGPGGRRTTVARKCA
jgi:hypothetical protein